MRFLFLIAFSSLLVAASANIECFQCTSSSNSKCATNDKASLLEFKKKCEPLSDGPFQGNNAVGCRKVTQSVEGETTVVRECAYSGTSNEGVKKTGNYGIHVWNYQCENSDPTVPCNDQSSKLVFISFLMIFVFFYIF